MNKKVVIASTRGNVSLPGTTTSGPEHHESYLRTVFAFLGLLDVTIVRTEGLAFGPHVNGPAIRKALSEIATIAV
ncbi:NAD(P)H-dependent oxidoreductase [Paraburkholderia sp. DGU8]|uniref:NAD(P)H-dependent oxidoreductase n=1 Tax=Paraburkholderia sp. DGU8 TaxID=3161997 RepID=UPI003465E59D